MREQTASLNNKLIALFATHSNALTKMPTMMQWQTKRLIGTKSILTRCRIDRRGCQLQDNWRVHQWSTSIHRPNLQLIHRYFWDWSILGRRLNHLHQTCNVWKYRCSWTGKLQYRCCLVRNQLIESQEFAEVNILLFLFLLFWTSSSTTKLTSLFALFWW